MRKMIIKHFIAAVIFASIFIVYNLFHIYCPIRAIFGFPCPTCGMTRALYYLIQGNVGMYLYYNPVTLPLCIALMLVFHKDKFHRKKIADIIVITIAIAVFSVYIYRIISGQGYVGEVSR